MHVTFRLLSSESQTNLIGKYPTRLKFGWKY